MTIHIIPDPKPKPDPIDNTTLVKDFRASGGQILHIRPTKRLRGVTFAFVTKGRRVEVATAVQHSADDFTKKIGTKTAIEHFLAGQKIVLPLSNSDKIVTVLKQLRFVL